MRHLRLNDFTGGQNQVLVPDRIADNQAVLLENVDLKDGTVASLAAPGTLAADRVNAAGPYLTLAGNGKLTGHTEDGDLVRCSGRTFRLLRSGDLRRLDEDTHADQGRTGAPWMDSAAVLTLAPEFRLSVKVDDRNMQVPLPAAFTSYGWKLKLVTNVAGRLDSVRVGDWIGFAQHTQRPDLHGAPPAAVRVLAVGGTETLIDVRVAEVGNTSWDLAYAVELLVDALNPDGTDAGKLRSFYSGSLSGDTGWQGDWFTPTYATGDDPGLGDFVDMADVLFHYTRLRQADGRTPGFLQPVVEPTVTPFCTGTLLSAVDSPSDPLEVTYTLRSAPPLARLWESGTPGRLIGVVDKEQSESFYTALEADGEYRYAVTLDWRDGMESAPFPPGTQHGPSVKVVESFNWQDVEQPAEDPSWFPRIQPRRYVMRVAFKPGFEDPDVERRYFPHLGIPQRVNLYRTVKDGAEYWLVKSWDLTLDPGNPSYLPGVFYDDVRDATILVQGPLQSAGAYPPLVAQRSSGSGYEYATGTMVAAEREGLIWIGSGRHLRFSNPGAPEEWPLENGHDFHTEIEAMAAFGPMIVCWLKDGTIYRVAGGSVADLEVQQADGSLRCLAHKGVVEYRGRLLFPTQDGLAEFNGVSASLLTEEPRWTDVRQVVVHENRVVALDKAGGYVVEPGFYMHRGQGTPGWQVTAHTVDALSGVVDTATGDLALGGDGLIRLWGGSSALETQMVSRVVDVGTIASPAHLSQVWIDVEGVWRVRVVLDGVTIHDQVADARSGRAVLPFRFPAGARGRKVQLLASGSGTLHGVEISYAALGVSPRRGGLE